MSGSAGLSLAIRLIFAVLLSTALIYTGSVAGNKANYELNKRQSFGSTGGNFQPARSERDSDAEVMEALAVEDVEDDDGVGGGEDVYRLYKGTGSTDDGWPDVDDWVSFEDMWENNKHIMSTSCERIFYVPNDSDSELSDLRDAIQTIAEETHLDHRFILAIIMQESGGCVRVPTSDYGVRNPGLMQSHNGASTCNENGLLEPCPKDKIEGMIRDGTAGTDDGDGLVQCVNGSGAEDVSAYYRAARCYNSGSVAESGLLEEGVATHCYASDVANRLLGWAETEKACWLDG